MSLGNYQALLQVTLKLPRGPHQMPRAAMRLPLLFGYLDHAICPIPVVLSPHQKLKLRYAENR